MFKLLLISKYLRRKLAPLFAALTVTLCTAMVIIVISVMGGFLDKLQESIQRLAPAVKVTTFTMTGLPHYEALCKRLEATPEVEAATPVVSTLGLMQVRDRRNDVMVMGVRPDELDRIVEFQESLFWRSSMLVEDAERRLAEPGLDQFTRSMWEQRRDVYAAMDLVGDGMAMQADPYWFFGHDELGDRPGIVPGIATLPYNRRDEQGQYMPSQHALGHEVTLTVVPMTQQGALQDPVLRRFVIANEFKSGHYEFDASLVFVPFDELQQMLRMDAFTAPNIDPETGEEIGGSTEVPGRASEVFITGSPGVSLDELREAVINVNRAFNEDFDDIDRLHASTWREENAVILGAVQNEKGLVTFLFAIISLVAVVMVATTFYMIVLEKTRDIGVLRAIGASRRGIAGMYLGYGLAIGLLGSIVGLIIAWAIVTNLNGIQHYLNAWFGWQMWDPRIYAFDTIPARIDYTGEALPIAAGAVISSVAGALIPALLAARLDPVEALRHE